MNIRSRLKQHYLASLEQSFKQFRWGAVLFFIGLLIIYCASQIWPPSLAQELGTLVGLVVVGTGFVIALLAEIRILIGRLMRFFNRPD